MLCTFSAGPNTIFAILRKLISLKNDPLESRKSYSNPVPFSPYFTTALHPQQGGKWVAVGGSSEVPVWEARATLRKVGEMLLPGMVTTCWLTGSWITHLALGSRSVLVAKAAVTDKETESLCLVSSRGSVVRWGKLLWHFKVLSSPISSEVTW